MSSNILPTHYNTPAVEEESSRPFVEYEFPKELLLHTDHLIPPLEIGFKGLEENKWTSITLWIEVKEG